MKKRAAASLLLIAAVLTACGGKEVSYQDGTYEGKSAVYEGEEEDGAGNGYGVAKVTITNGAITDCTFMTYDEDGTEKGEDYGKEDGRIANRDYYNKAQKANAARDEYASMLIENGQLDGIDAISGATINYHEFVEAVENALAEAEE